VDKTFNKSSSVSIKIVSLVKQIAKKSPSKFKIGCVILNKSKIVISTGYNNMTKTHPKCPTWGNFIHAELDALIGVDFNKTYKGTAYIYREKANGQKGMSKPCKICFLALQKAGIKKIIYSTENAIIEENI